MTWSFIVPGQQPSWNHAYATVYRRDKGGRTYKGRARTPEVIAYQQAVGFIVGVARPGDWEYDGGHVRLEVELHLGRDIDATNVWKILEDAIARKLDIDDKHFLVCFTAKEIGCKQPYVRVAVA